MNIINQLFESNKKTNNTIVLISFYALSLLIIRAKFTQSVYLFFLIWNLILAIIPYITSLYIINKYDNLNTWKLIILLSNWLLFLPNSFYIITDLLHTSKSSGILFYYDLLLISSFAIIGFLLGLNSILHFEMICKKSNLLIKLKNYLLLIIFYLCGLGIYLGRILRFNSWDIINNPIELFSTTISKITEIETALFTIHFGTFILLSYFLFHNLNFKTNHND